MSCQHRFLHLAVASSEPGAGLGISEEGGESRIKEKLYEEYGTVFSKPN